MDDNLKTFSLMINVVFIVGIVVWALLPSDSVSLRIAEWKCAETIASGTDAVCLRYERIQSSKVNPTAVDKP